MGGAGARQLPPPPPPPLPGAASAVAAAAAADPRGGRPRLQWRAAAWPLSFPGRPPPRGVGGGQRGGGGWRAAPPSGQEHPPTGPWRIRRARGRGVGRSGGRRLQTAAEGPAAGAGGGGSGGTGHTPSSAPWPTRPRLRLPVSPPAAAGHRPCQRGSVSAKGGGYWRPQPTPVGDLVRGQRGPQGDVLGVLALLPLADHPLETTVVAVEADPAATAVSQKARVLVRPPPPLNPSEASAADGRGVFPPYRNRCTIGQLTMMPADPNVPPSGAVM